MIHVLSQTPILSITNSLILLLAFDTCRFGGFLVLIPRFPLCPYSPPEENSFPTKESRG